MSESKVNLNDLASRRTTGQKYRLHKFPPLRKAWQVTAANNTLSIDPAEYQRQLVEGFQEGVDKGFVQGLEEGKEQGYQEGAQLGFSEGLKKGELEGRETGKSLFEQATRPFGELTQQLQDYFDGYDVRRREELLQLVEKVTRQVIRCELSLQPTQLLALVEEALSGLPSIPAQIRVLLNPQEFARINDVEPEKVRDWGLVADPDMPAGECRIITDTTEMDVGCEHRLEQCMDVLAQNLLPENGNA